MMRFKCPHCKKDIYPIMKKVAGEYYVLIKIVKTTKEVEEVIKKEANI